MKERVEEGEEDDVELSWPLERCYTFKSDSLFV